MWIAAGAPLQHDSASTTPCALRYPVKGAIDIEWQQSITGIYINIITYTTQLPFPLLILAIAALIDTLLIAELKTTDRNGQHKRLPKAHFHYWRVLMRIIEVPDQLPKGLRFSQERKSSITAKKFRRTHMHNGEALYCSAHKRQLICEGPDRLCQGLDHSHFILF
jgi:hypothetical protein